jgi:hypothetical protein
MSDKSGQMNGSKEMFNQFAPRYVTSETQA